MDFAISLLIDLYGHRRDPNNPEIRERAPIDVYDMARYIMSQNEEIKKLNIALDNLGFILDGDVWRKKVGSEWGPQDNGSEKFIP